MLKRRGRLRQSGGTEFYHRAGMRKGGTSSEKGPNAKWREGRRKHDNMGGGGASRAGVKRRKRRILRG